MRRTSSFAWRVASTWDFVPPEVELFWDSRSYALVVGLAKGWRHSGVMRDDKDSNLVLLQSFGAGACP